MINKKEVAKRLISLRGKKTQKEVSEGMGIAQSTYAMYETAKRVPTDENKIRIASYYKKSVQSIFYAQNSHKAI